MQQKGESVRHTTIEFLCTGCIYVKLLKIRMQFDPFETVLCRIAERPLYIREIRMQGHEANQRVWVFGYRLGNETVNTRDLFRYRSDGLDNKPRHTGLSPQGNQGLCCAVIGNGNVIEFGNAAYGGPADLIRKNMRMRINNHVTVLPFCPQCVEAAVLDRLWAGGLRDSHKGFGFSFQYTTSFTNCK